ncbi:hypothetical protein SASPL_146940 [Salvia splendens]|uniref:Uncharacterized protein n=1 Tax=Salvia splendens TaxID=180675 RepID=A0A8X8WEV7_SALSN|nr:hypothetical protein SASPL_146940 [Salvia splendens]
MSDHHHNRTANYDRITSKRWFGIKGVRLNSRRFSVQRLRTNFFSILRVFNKWKSSYNKCLRLLGRNLARKAGNAPPARCSYSTVRTTNHSSSFCSEAIADCLEFIKRNSVSNDDEKECMLN